MISGRSGSERGLFCKSCVSLMGFHLEFGITVVKFTESRLFKLLVGPNLWTTIQLQNLTLKAHLHICENATIASV